MSQLSRRKFLQLAGVTAGTAALGACVAPAAAPQPAPAAPEAAEPTAEAAEPAPAAEGGVVKWAEFYSLLTDANGKINQDWLASVIKQFEDENPGWKVEQEGIKWDQIDQKAILDLSAGVDHDLMFSSPQLMAKHAETGTYIDLTPSIATLPQEEVADLSWSPGYKSATVNGQQIGMATGVHTRTNVYRRDWFEEAGLDPDKPLTTLAEIVETAKMFTKPDDDVWGLGLYLGPSRATIELYYGTIVWGLGGEYFDEAAQKATLTTPESLEATQWLYDCVHTYKVTPPYSYAPDADYGFLINNNFIDNKLAISFGSGSYWIGSIEEANMLEGCFPATAECKVGTAGYMIPPGPAFTNAWCLSTHKLSKQPDAAFKLMMTVMQPENLKAYPDAGLPARLTAWAAPEYSTDMYNLWLETAKGGRGVPATPYYPELADAVAAAIQEVLSKNADIEATMKKTEDEWNAKYAG
jgi:ABC-type glycerol-3-phosphate transport system substrate-binding protein